VDLGKDEHSTEGKDVYTNVVLSDVHLFRGTDGMWFVSETEDMAVGECTGAIVSNFFSPKVHGVV